MRQYAIAHSIAQSIFFVLFAVDLYGILKNHDFFQSVGRKPKQRFNHPLVSELQFMEKINQG